MQRLRSLTFAFYEPLLIPHTEMKTKALNIAPPPPSATCTLTLFVLACPAMTMVRCPHQMYPV